MYWPVQSLAELQTQIAHLKNGANPKLLEDALKIKLYAEQSLQEKVETRKRQENTIALHNEREALQVTELADAISAKHKEEDELKQQRETHAQLDQIFESSTGLPPRIIPALMKAFLRIGRLSNDALS